MADANRLYRASRRYDNDTRQRTAPNAEETATNIPAAASPDHTLHRFHADLNRLEKYSEAATMRASELNGLLNSLPAGSITMGTHMKELQKRCLKDQKWLGDQITSSRHKSDPWWKVKDWMLILPTTPEGRVLLCIDRARKLVDSTLKCYSDKEQEVANEKRYLADRHTNQDQWQQRDMLGDSNVNAMGSTCYSPPPAWPIARPYEMTKPTKMPSSKYLDGQPMGSTSNWVATTTTASPTSLTGFPALPKSTGQSHTSLSQGRTRPPGPSGRRVMLSKARPRNMGLSEPTSHRPRVNIPDSSSRDSRGIGADSGNGPDKDVLPVAPSNDNLPLNNSDLNDLLHPRLSDPDRLERLVTDCEAAKKCASKLIALLESMPTGAIIMDMEVQELQKRCSSDMELLSFHSGWARSEADQSRQLAISTPLNEAGGSPATREERAHGTLTDVYDLICNALAAYNAKEEQVALEKQEKQLHDVLERSKTDIHMERWQEMVLLDTDDGNTVESSSYPPVAARSPAHSHETTKTVSGDEPETDAPPANPSLKALGKRPARQVDTDTICNSNDKPAPKRPSAWDHSITDDEVVLSKPTVYAYNAWDEGRVASGKEEKALSGPVAGPTPLKKAEISPATPEEPKLLRSVLSLLPEGNPPFSPTFELPYELLPDNPDDMKRLVADRGAVLKLRALLMSYYSGIITNDTKMKELHKRALLAQRLLSSQINRAKHEADHSPTQLNEEKISSDTIERSSPDDFLDVYHSLCLCLAQYSVEDEDAVEEQQFHETIERSKTDTRMGETDAEKQQFLDTIERSKADTRIDETAAEEQQVLDAIERSKTDTRMDPQQKAALLADDFGDGLVASSSLLKDTVQTKPTPSNFDPPSEEDHEDLQKLYFSKRFQPSVYAYDAMAVAVAREKEESIVAIAREKEEKSGTVPISCEKGEKSGTVAIAGEKEEKEEKEEKDGTVAVAPEKAEEAGPVPIAREKGQKPGAGNVSLVTALLYVAFTLHICYCTWVTMRNLFA